MLRAAVPGIGLIVIVVAVVLIKNGGDVADVSDNVILAPVTPLPSQRERQCHCHTSPRHPSPPPHNESDYPLPRALSQSPYQGDPSIA